MHTHIHTIDRGIGGIIKFGKVLLLLFAMTIEPVSIATSIGFGGVAGFLIGYAIKKVMKLALIIVGLFFAAIAYLAHQQIITINWDRFAASSQQAVTGIQNVTTGGGAIPGAVDQTASALANIGIPLTGSFAAAFVFGFMKG